MHRNFILFLPLSPPDPLRIVEFDIDTFVVLCLSETASNFEEFLFSNHVMISFQRCDLNQNKFSYDPKY